MKVMQRQKCKSSCSFLHPQEDTPTSQRTPTGSSSQVVSCCQEVGSKMDPATAPVGGIKRSISNNHINRSHLSHFNRPCAAPSPPRSPNVPSSCSLQPISSFFQLLQLAMCSAHSPASHVLLLLPRAPSLCHFMGHSSQSTTGARC